MIEAAEATAGCSPGGTIVEATAGNTGLGLALVGTLKGYRLMLVVPDKMAREKILHLRALGAEVRITRSDVGKGHPEYYQDMAAAHRRGHARRVLRQPVRQPGQSAGARDDHRPGDLGADGAASRRGGRAASAPAARSPAWPLLRGGLAEDRDGARRSGRARCWRR